MATSAESLTLVPDEEEAGASSRAMKVARILVGKGGEEFAKPGKLVEVRFVKGQSLSLTASRLLALMILAAGGDAWQAMPHRMRKADIRRGHKGNERISDMLEELHLTLFAEDDTSWRGKKATKRFPLIQMSREEVDDDGGAEAGWIEWEFTPDARRLIQQSESYAILNRQAVLGFRSSYALRLYEMGALRIHRRMSFWRGDMAALRAALGISPEVYKDYAQLRRKVLEVAKAEIDQLAHFTVEWTETRKGRSVTDLEIRFVAKQAPAQLETVDELTRHSVGRQARRENTVAEVRVVEQGSTSIGTAAKAALAKVKRSAYASPTPLTFPSGSLSFGDDELRDIAIAHGGGWDVDMIADAYRSQMGGRLSLLSGQKLLKSWTGFCQSWFSRRGRP
jgi:hypothetical protein